MNKEFKKALKETRLKEFLGFHSLEISHASDVKIHKSDGYIIILQDESLQEMIYYPKSDRLLIPKTNKWINNGLHYIYDIFNIKEEK